jgi:hypothetical protein
MMTHRRRKVGTRLYNFRCSRLWPSSGYRRAWGSRSRSPGPMARLFRKEQRKPAPVDLGVVGRSSGAPTLLAPSLSFPDPLSASGGSGTLRSSAPPSAEYQDAVDVTLDGTRALIAPKFLADDLRKPNRGGIAITRIPSTPSTTSMVIRYVTYTTARHRFSKHFPVVRAQYRGFKVTLQILTGFLPSP